MSVKTGAKLSFPEVGVEIIVTMGGDAELSVAPVSEGGDPLRVGKRYESESTGLQVLVVKPGAVELWCDGEPMTVKDPKKTKAAD